ncbi:hypothetical protein AVEN_101732-1 [Araneus ventricosus]|uniref:Uncharacterized protein n=1 Tax=Araneus ventricosus TaxID=182803 RepID=A0A4Y2HSW0_ARAVE|nr:hypothetical protein AVEN_101732-1 [Araneus ventricosus]
MVSVTSRRINCLFGRVIKSRYLGKDKKSSAQFEIHKPWIFFTSGNTENSFLLRSCKEEKLMGPQGPRADDPLSQAMIPEWCNQIFSDSPAALM